VVALEKSVFKEIVSIFC